MPFTGRVPGRRGPAPIAFIVMVVSDPRLRVVPRENKTSPRLNFSQQRIWSQEAYFTQLVLLHTPYT